MTDTPQAPSPLRKLLRCPACKGELAWNTDQLSCASCEQTFAVVEGIPVMLPATGAASAETLDEHKRMQSEYFDEHSDVDFEITRPHGTPALYRWLLEEKFRRSVGGLELSRYGTALTVCGGSGMDAEFLSRKGVTVITSDISLGAALRARERARRFGVEMAVLVADVEGLPFADSSVDLVYVHDGLHHLTNPLTGLDEMARVASGAVSVTEPAKAVATAIAVKLGLSIDVEEAGNRVERLRVHDVVDALAARGFRPGVAERYAMLYRHEPGPVMRLLSFPGVFIATKMAWRALNGLIGRIGNKLTVQASR